MLKPFLVIYRTKAQKKIITNNSLCSTQNSSVRKLSVILTCSKIAENIENCNKLFYQTQTKLIWLVYPKYMCSGLSVTVKLQKSPK